MFFFLALLINVTIIFSINSLKEYSADLALHFYNIVWLMMDS